VTLLAYRFALGPTPSQERALRSHAGAARVAFNWGLARVKANLGQREAEKSYGIAGDGLTSPVSWSLYSLRKDWNVAKDTVAPWWRECSKEAFNTGLDHLARALKNWAGSRNGKRKGKPAGFPRFKSKRKARLSVRWTTGSFRCEERHAVLPRIGRVKLHEDGRRLADLVAAGTARVLSVTARFERGRWFASFAVETEVSRPAPRVRRSESQARPPGTHVRLHHLRHRPGPGRQRRGEPRTTGRECPGQQRTWSRPSDGTRPAGGCETSTRHRASGSDRERPNARRDCGMSIIERSAATVPLGSRP